MPESSTRHPLLKYLLLALILSLGATALLRADEPFSFAETFAAGQAAPNLQDNWKCGFAWEWREGALRHELGARQFAVPKNSPYGRSVRVEVALTLSRAVGTEWKVAGAAIYTDPDNFWHLALVESPDTKDEKSKKHYVELSEMRAKTWLANSKLPPLPLEKLPPFEWQYNQTYRMVLELKPGQMLGQIYDSAGQLVWQSGQKLDDAAVASGRPGVDNGGFAAAFRDFKATVADTVPGPAETKVEFPAYDRPGLTGVSGQKTGFFHVEKQDDRWWVIDPQGQGFYIIATDHVSNRGMWCQALGYSPYARNIEKKYPNPEAWAENATSRLKAWGFNSLGAGCVPFTYHKGMAHTLFVSIGSIFCSYGEAYQITFPENGKATPCSYFPNVFHPRFEEYCRARAEEFCAPNREDPWLLGYFLDNELAWWGKSRSTSYGLFEECMAKPATHSAKPAVVDWLRQRYGTVDKLNGEWGAKLASFDQLLNETVLTGTNVEAVEAAKTAFSRFVAERYFSVAAAAIRAVDPNHMLLGCRFAGLFSPSYEPAWGPCGQYCDIVTTNVYEKVDLTTGEVYANVKGERRPLAEGFAQTYARTGGKPLWVTEWSFPSYDSGLPCKHGAGQRVDTQAEKTFAFTAFQKLLFGLPCLAGSSYFMWVDQPALGISEWFPEDSNYGLVTEQDEPWELLTKAATALNPKVGDIHLGLTAELAVAAGQNGEFQLTNSGRQPADCRAQLWLDGQVEEQRLTLAPGETKSLKSAAAAKAGGHFWRCAVENAGDAVEVNLADNSATQVTFTPVGDAAGLPAARLAPVVVYNATAKPMPYAFLTLSQTDLPFDLKAPENQGKLAVAELSAAGEPVFLPTQVDLFADGAELCVKVPELAPYAARTLLVCRRDQAAEPAPAAIQFTSTGDTFELASGRLKISKLAGTGELFDRIELDGAELGKFHPLVHQALPQDMWAGPDKLTEVKAVSGPVRLVLDSVMARQDANAGVITAVNTDGKQEKTEQPAGQFRVGVRTYIYPEQNWFAARLLWVENADARPWKLCAYFHFAPSNLAGSAADDEAHQTGYWEDKKAGLCYGAIDPTNAFTLSYFTDKAGLQHPDARRAVDVALQSGEKWQAPQPCLYFAGAATAKDGEWKQVQADLAARTNLGFRVITQP